MLHLHYSTCTAIVNTAKSYSKYNSMSRCLNEQVFSLCQCKYMVQIITYISKHLQLTHMQDGFAFSALTLLVGHQEGHPACKKLSGGMLAWLSGMRCRLAYSPADATATHTISCSSKSRLVLTFLVLPFWYLLTWVVPDIFQKSSKTVVCMCVCAI